MVRLDSRLSNQLFEVLAQWNKELEALGPDALEKLGIESESGTDAEPEPEPKAVHPKPQGPRP